VFSSQLCACYHDDRQQLTVMSPAGAMNVVIPPGCQPGSVFMVAVSNQPVMMQQPVMQQQILMQTNIPYGAPPGGHYESEQYCGVVTILIGIFLFPCVCCCPCDSRQVYVAPDGRRFMTNY
jgi:hypothetical protein